MRFAKKANIKNKRRLAASGAPGGGVSHKACIVAAGATVRAAG
jgi:hypothetical protein